MTLKPDPEGQLGCDSIYRDVQERQLTGTESRSVASGGLGGEWGAAANTQQGSFGGCVSVPKPHRGKRAHLGAAPSTGCAGKMLDLTVCRLCLDKTCSCPPPHAASLPSANSPSARRVHLGLCSSHPSGRVFAP